MYHQRSEQQNIRPLVEPLTKREIEVLSLLVLGLRNRAIALALCITEHTVKYHLNSIYSKLCVDNRTSAVYIAGMLGLLTKNN